MKIVRSKTTYQVFYQFSNGTEISIDQYGLKTPKFRALDMKPDTHEIVEDVPKTDDWKIPSMSYDTSWEIYDQTLYDELYARELDVQIERKCNNIMSLRIQKTYSDTTVEFSPGISGDIQFRNDFDRQNLSDVALGALAISTLQNPNKLMYYRDAADVIHEVRAGELVTIALNVLDIKQEVVSKSWVHKDAVKLKTTLEEVKAYDINEGW
jgi:hypothetical protein